jgi:nicotinamide mononucleotide transporter
MLVADILSPLNYVLFVFGSDHVSVSELVGFLTGVWCVWLTVRARISNFPVGLANDAFFLILFLEARLFADASLQIVYLVLGVAGWWAWLQARPQRTKLVVSAASPLMLAACVPATVAITAILWPILQGAHDVAPFLDALTTALSLVAQTLLNLKRIQNWWAWMVADVIYVPLYISKNLYLTALVYLLFLALCGAGLREWRRALRPGPVTRPEVVTV